MDSATNVYITYDLSLFKIEIYRKYYNKTIAIANNLSYRILGKGTVKINILNKNGEPNSIGITNIYYIPEMGYNLISLGILEAKGY